MKSGLRLLLEVGLLLGLCTGLALFLPRWLAEAALDWCAPAEFPLDSLSAEQVAELERRKAVAIRRLETKHELTLEVIKGQLSLLEAASRFRSLNEGLHTPASSRRFPGATTEERQCQEVIYWVREVMACKPQEPNPELVKRLEAELRHELSQPGGLSLPAVKPEGFP